MVIVKSCSDKPTACGQRSTCHFIKAETAGQACELAKQECYKEGPWGKAFPENEEVFASANFLTDFAWKLFVKGDY